MPILPICRQKLSVCGSFELNSFASFLITDNDQSASSLYRNISARIIISNLEDTVLAIRIDRNNYTINYLTKQLGTHIVAIKRYTPKDTQKQIGAKFLASSDLVMMSESRTSRFMDLKSRVSSIGINNDSDIRETIKFLVTVRHPSITPVLGGVFVNGKELCLVLELMELGSLWDCLHNVLFPIEGELVHSFLLSISKGMCFLHAATPPIRHGDLKSGEDESIEIRKFRWTMLCISLTTKPYRSFIHKTLNTFAQDRPALFSYTTSNCMLTQQTSLLTRTLLQKSPTSEKV